LHAACDSGADNSKNRTIILETFLLPETKTPIRGKSFHGKPNFHDHVRLITDNSSNDPATVGPARRTG
jgi:hypothetical protein